jgi:hypothetical protein
MLRTLLRFYSDYLNSRVRARLSGVGVHGSYGRKSKPALMAT